jgi:hypothetical protein
MIVTVTPGSSGNPVNQPLGVGNETGVNAYGGVGIVKKTGLSSDIPVSTAPVSILTAFNSDIEIEDIILETDATGLAGGTTFEVRKSDALGLKVEVSMAVSSLGANVTKSFFGSTPWTVWNRFVLPQGATLQIDATVAACTGAGAWSMWVVYRPMTAAGSLA